MVQGWELQLLQSLGCYEGTGYKNKTEEGGKQHRICAEVVIRLCLKWGLAPDPQVSEFSIFKPGEVKFEKK